MLQELAKPAVADPLEASLAELEEYRDLGPGWDSYGALEVSDATIRFAQDLLTRLWSACEAGDAAWSRPTLSPGSDGGIAISWQRGNRRVLLQVRPGQPLLDAVHRIAGAAPDRRDVTPAEAVELALWALSGDPQGNDD